MRAFPVPTAWTVRVVAAPTAPTMPSLHPTLIKRMASPLSWNVARPSSIDDIRIIRVSLRTELSVELGVESFHNETLGHIHRGHTVEQTFEAIGKLSERKIPVCIHLIFGLPFETPSQWMEDVQIFNRLPVQFLKFHQLQIFKNTAMAVEYAEHPERFHAFAAEEYVRFICDYLERMSPEIIVERFSAEVPPRYLAVSNWHLLRHDAIVRAIEAELTLRDAWQGCKC